MRNIIELKHHTHDYECMWNGIEDLYMNQTDEQLPPDFFFLLAAYGSFCYLRTDKSDIKRMVAFGDGRTKQMYKILAPLISFDYKHYAYKTFNQALTKAKKEINAGYPIVLGALDMYYLAYLPKLYHMDHIPFHYVLMVGYDDEQQIIFLYDCSREELQQLSYTDLKAAMNCSYPGLSHPNTVCTIRMHAETNKYQLAKDALSWQSKQFLEPSAAFLGYKGFTKFIQELPTWKSQMTKMDYHKLLTNMLMFFGSVPTLPNALRGIQEPDTITFQGGFDKMANMLISIGMEYDQMQWKQAAKLFQNAAVVIAQISDILIAYLTHEKDETDNMAALFSDVLANMKEAYMLLI